MPAYVANGAPVVFSRFYRGVLHPVDAGRVFVDGRRVLGDSKSVEGFLVGVAAGSVMGLLEALFSPDPGAVAARGFLMALGAMLGDMLGSFAKRRLGLRPGAPAPLLDQLDFLILAVLLADAAGLASFSAGDVALLAAVTLVLHYSTNYAAYRLGWKKVPW